MVQYGSVSTTVLASWMAQYERIPKRYQALLGDFQKGWEECRAAAQQNGAVMREIVGHAEMEGSVGPALTAAKHHAALPNTHLSIIDAKKVLNGALVLPRYCTAWVICTTCTTV
jgi:hypothetical protein